ncbi:MAG: methyl-accepting chemotaxis [Geobacteraceae bacterium]|nr:MAG: methyl-accepting chemotaxis [Geobacteraceae bacterium]
MRWSDLKVKTKLLVLIMGGCLVLAAVGAMGLADMKKVSAGLGKANSSMEHIASLQGIKNDFLFIRLDLVYMMALTDAAKIKEKADDLAKRVQNVKNAMAGYENENPDAGKQEHLKSFREGFEAYLAQGNRLAEMAKSAALSGNAQARADVMTFATGSVAPLYNRPAEAIARLVEYELKGGEETYTGEMARYHTSVKMTVGIILAVLAGAFFVGIAIAKSISKPIERVFGTLAKVAAGDLTARSDIDTRDEMGMLAREVNEMGERLQAIIGQVAQNAAQVAAAASQLHSTSEQMATGAEEVAAQAGSVATAGEEMAATSAEIAQNCSMAAGGAKNANDSATTGASVVQQTVTVMSRIAERVRESAHTVESLGSRSDQIGAIIGTIEDIADQTNLLALNAAIEAARAGEQGRGFAVVADEVRALAERTTKATREIGEMIKAVQQETKGAVAAMEEGVKEVEMGTAEAAKSGQALQDILDQINAVTMQINQVATAAEEQTATTNEISNSMQQITEVVQETSNGAHESAGAASQLAHLAEELQRLVGQFKLAA